MSRDPGEDRVINGPGGQMRVSASYEYIRLFIETMNIEAGYEFLEAGDHLDPDLAVKAHNRYFGVDGVDGDRYVLEPGG